MVEKRRGLGKGLGALIPSSPQSIPHNDRPVDLLFRERPAEDEKRRRSPLIPVGDDEDESSVMDVVVKRQAGKRPDAVSPKDPGKPPSRSGRGDAGRDPSLSKVSRETSKVKEMDVPRETSAGGDTPDGSGRLTTTPSQVSDSPLRSPELMAVPGALFVEIELDQIRMNPRQPRHVFDEDALEELRQSILQVGILQPIVVRTIPGEPGYELIMGERRWRASQAAGLDRIPAIVRDTSDDDLLRDALLENLHRSNLNPLEEAAAYDQLLTDFGCTHEELASRIGRSRPQISNTIRLLRLPALVQRRVAAGVLSSGHARALLSLADPAAMERLAQRVVAEGLSVRATEEIVSMGGVEEKPVHTRQPAARLNSEALDVITTRLSDALETRVSAAMSKRKGRLTIEFADMDDLNRILSGLAPGVGENKAE